MYKSWVREAGSSDFQIQEHKFMLAHFLLESHAGISHRVSYCANDCVVVEEAITKKIPNLTPVLETPDPKGKLVYAGYLSSDYLDKNANQQRNWF